MTPDRERPPVADPFDYIGDGGAPRPQQPDPVEDDDWNDVTASGYAGAFELSRTAHAGQVNLSGADYFTDHVLRVTALAARIAPAALIDRATVVALLHDVVEDTSVTLADLAARFGTGVRDDVDAVTYRRVGAGRDWESYAELIDRACARPVSTVVKLADNCQNYGTLHQITDAATVERLTRKYQSSMPRLRLAYRLHFGEDALTLPELLPPPGQNAMGDRG